MTQLTSREMQQIDAAILSHSRWITRLKIAIEDGTSAFDPDLVMNDNNCDFGRWLYDDFPKSEAGGESFEQIRDTHAAFHKKAANILRLALQGHRADALSQMELQGDFISLSSRLILMLRELRER